MFRRNLHWGRPWKLDIWSLRSSVVEKSLAELDDLRDRMTPRHRALILETKYQLQNDAGQTPVFSGIYIYRAVIDKGLEKLGDIVEFLRESRVTV